MFAFTPPTNYCKVRLESIMARNEPKPLVEEGEDEAEVGEVEDAAVEVDEEEAVDDDSFWLRRKIRSAF